MAQRRQYNEPEFNVRAGGVAVDCGCGDGKITYDVHAVIDEKITIQGDKMFLVSWAPEWIDERHFNAPGKLAAYRRSIAESTDSV